MSMQEEYRKLSLWMTYSVCNNSKSLEEKVIVIKYKKPSISDCCGNPTIEGFILTSVLRTGISLLPSDSYRSIAR